MSPATTLVPLDVMTPAFHKFTCAEPEGGMFTCGAVGAGVGVIIAKSPLNAAAAKYALVAETEAVGAPVYALA